MEKVVGLEVKIPFPGWEGNFTQIGDLGNSNI
jgi:hypothetical protein